MEPTKPSRPPSSDRFERLRRHVSQLPPLSPWVRVLLLFTGWLLILLGLAGLVLPGLQGVLLLILGAALLSLASNKALEWLRLLFRRWPRGWRLLLRWRRKLHAWLSGES